MAESEAQRRANLAYRKKHTKTVSLTFYPSDMHLFEYLDGLGVSKAGYLKRLLAEDAKRNGHEFPKKDQES